MASQSQLKRDDLMNEAQAVAYDDHMKEVSGQQSQHEHHKESSYFEKSGEQVRHVAQGAADMATGAARGAAAGAANFAHGAADAMNNAFGTNKHDKKS